ncbi:MAG TPA: AAA family ATPase [Pseudonocardiaceae bacterium]|nr:AAA family ATPase [Pseudonocardiaceae bacterium]
MAGRDAELTHLTGVLSDVLAGRPHAVVISGAAGIGKTRLVMEALAVARARGFVALSAGAAPLEQDLSYAPIVRALRPLLDGDDDRRAALVSGLPDLARLFDGPDLPEPAPGLDDPGLARTRLFEAVRQFLQRAVAIHPIALLVDDVHWLDRASQALVGYLARCLTDSRLLILLTYRDDEPHGPAVPLLDTLRWAGRVPHATAGLSATSSLALSELTLSALAPPDLATLASELLGGEPPAGLIRLLADRAAGVPLFAQALISTLAATGALSRVAGRWVLRPTAADLVPGPARALLEQRLDVLPAAARRVLEVICLGPETTARVVARVDRNSETEVIASLATLRRSGLISEEQVRGMPVYRPAHPMLAEVAMRSLSSAQRQALHAATAAALEKDGRTDILLLAYHLRCAGALVEPAKAFGVLAEAVGVALRRRAGEEAVSFAQTALDLMADHRLPGDRAALLISLADGAQLVGRLDQALTATLDAAGIGEPLDRAYRLGTAAEIAKDLGHVDQAERCLRDADQLIEGLPLGPVHVFLGELGVDHAAHHDRREFLDARVRRVADLAERTGLVRARAVLELARLTQDLDDGHVVEAMHRIDGLLGLSRRLADPLFTERALRPITQALLSHGDLAAAADSADEGIALAHQIGSSALAAMHLSHLAMARILQGRHSDASTLSGKLIGIGERLSMARVTALGITLAALIARRRGRLAEAEALIAEVWARFGGMADTDRHLFGVVDVVQGLVRLDRGDLPGAVKSARSALRRPTSVRVYALSIQAHGLIGDGRLAEASRTADLLRAQTNGKDLAAAQVERVEAQLLAADGDQEGSARLFAAAADSFDRLGMAADAALSRLDAISRLPVGAGPPEWLGPRPPRETLAHVVEVLEECGNDPGVNRGKRLLRKYGGTVGSVRARRTRPAGLSPREEEVVRLVAAGLSNPAIAERLVISTRTVTTHLQKVYARLGIRSRAAMTRWVMENLET